MNGSSKITKPSSPGTIMPRRITPPPPLTGTPMPGTGKPPSSGIKPKLFGTPMPGTGTPRDRSFDLNRVPGLTNL